MAHNAEENKRFLEILATTPFISHACKVAGISRATIYRWMKDNPRFRQKVQRALDSGRKNLVDLAEMSLVNKIKSGDINATKFFLAHNSKRYRSQSQTTFRQQGTRELPKPESKPAEEKFWPLSEETWRVVDLLEEAKKKVKEAGGQVYQDPNHHDPE